MASFERSNWLKISSQSEWLLQNNFSLQDWSLFNFCKTEPIIVHEQQERLQGLTNFKITMTMNFYCLSFIKFDSFEKKMLNVIVGNW